MKNMNQGSNSHMKQQVNKNRPENKDDMDSRERKDQNYTDHNNKAGKKPNSRDKNQAGN